MTNTVLFVDDEVSPRLSEPLGDYMWYYAEACREAGFDVRESQGVDDALRLLREGIDVQIVVLDLLMAPGKTLKGKTRHPFDAGVQFAELLQERFPELRIVVLSNARALVALDRLDKLDCVKHVLCKAEVTPFELVSILHKLLELGDSRPISRAQHSPRAWKALLDKKRQRAFAMFLKNPKTLNAADFFLLSDVAHDLMRRLVADVSANDDNELKRSDLTVEQLLAHLETERNKAAMGKFLEDLVAKLFETVPGFVVRTRLLTRTEEIDIFILNGSEIPPWRDMGPAILGECKKWSEKSGAKEYRDFSGKMRTKRGQCRCGFFVSWRGFTKAFIEEDMRASKDDFIILRIDQTHLREAISVGDFNAVLTKLWHEALQT